MGAAVRVGENIWALPTRPQDGWPKSELPGKPGNGKHRAATVLVVEDEVLIRMPVADFLRDRGFRVIEASSAAEAQAMFQANEPIEVVFSDVNMPGEMNGLGLVRWVRQNYPDVRILLTSGVVTKSALEPGDVDAPLFDKPYSFDRLAEQIRKLIGG